MESYKEMQETLARSSVDTVEITWDGMGDNRHQHMVALDFYREHVAHSRPCIIKGMMADWPAMARWSENAYLEGILDNGHDGAHLTIACTPNGRADAVTTIVTADREQRLFMSGFEKKMTAAELLAGLRTAKNYLLEKKKAKSNPYRVNLNDKEHPMIVYAQLQNDCLNGEYEVLKQDIGPSVSEFGQMVFGTGTDAANVWIGNGTSATSMHRDWYENLYAVVRGEKRFTMVAPWEAPLLSKADFPDATYDFNDGQWSVKMDEEGKTTPWIDVDIIDDDISGDEAARQLNPINVSVGAGEVFYLPSTWFHRVGQHATDEEDDPSDVVVAVNFWYDMAWGPQVAMNKFVDDACRELRKR